MISGKHREIDFENFPLATLSMAREQAVESKPKAFVSGDPLAEKHKAKMDTGFGRVVEVP